MEDWKWLFVYLPLMHADFTTYLEASVHVNERSDAVAYYFRISEHLLEGKFSLTTNTYINKANVFLFFIWRKQCFAKGGVMTQFPPKYATGLMPHNYREKTERPELSTLYSLFSSANSQISWEGQNFFMT